MDTKTYRRPLLSGALAVLAAGLLAQACQLAPGASASQEKPTSVTKVAATAPAPVGKEEATLAAGCFWSMEAIFKQLKGVDRVVPGYSGGNLKNPSYEQVETGTTGHAETVDITFNPKVISYEELLKVYFTIRNPTTPNQQGPDAGPQYRSVIFYHNEAQKRAAERVIKDVASQHLWHAPIVTEVKPFSHFYQAEDYHLNYYNLHPDEGYCKFVIAPEIQEFHQKFGDKLK